MYRFFVNRQQGTLQEILAGFTTGLYLFPEILAIAFLAGIPPQNALFSASLSCLIAALFTGSPGMITGSSRAIALICVTIVIQHGTNLLFPAVILGGVFQFLIGYFKLGKFIRLVPRSVYMGFLNGFSILLLLYLLKSIYTLFDHPSQLFEHNLWVEVIVFGLSLTLIFVLPRFFKLIPSILVLFVVAIGGIYLFGGEEVVSLQTYFDSFQVELGDMQFSGIYFEGFTVIEFVEVILPFGLLLAFFTSVESLLCVMMVDELTGQRGTGNQECRAQGVANIFAGFVMGLPSVGMIGATAVNVKSGGKKKLSAIITSFTLVITSLFLSPILSVIPFSVFLAINFSVFIGLFSWSGVRFFHRIPLRDTITLIIVSGLTILTEYPALVVLFGVIVSALVFAWENAIRIRVYPQTIDEKTKLYNVRGVLFFASFNHFLDKFDVENDPENIIIDFKDARIVDHSGIDAIYSLSERYLNKESKLKLRYLSRDSKFLIKNSAIKSHVHLHDDPSDPEYKVVTDKVIESYE
jgi:SulP family sulfate permease